MPKIVDHEEYREQLIWRCFSTFADGGFSRCTMKQLASAAGVTPGTLYHYFPDKTALFESVVQTVAHSILKTLREVVGEDGGMLDKLRRLGDFLDRNEAYLARQNRLWCEVLQMDDAYKDSLRPLYEQFRSLLRSIFDDPSVQAAAREPLTTMLAALTDGLIFHRQYDDGLANFKETLDLFGRRLAGTPDL